MPFLALVEDLMLNGIGAEREGVCGGDATAALWAGIFLRISSNGFAKHHSLTCPSVCVAIASTSGGCECVSEDHTAQATVPVDFREA